MGLGSVTKQPDKAKYASGDVVTLTAVPAGGETFVAWSGDVISTDNPTAITIGGDRVVTATFTGGGGGDLPTVPGGTALAGWLAKDKFALNDGDPISAWSDHSGNGNDLVLGAGADNPTKVTSGGKTAIHFAYGQWMQGTNFADALPAFAVFIQVESLADTDPPSDSSAFPIVCKINNEGDGAGWICEGVGNINFWTQDAGGNNLNANSVSGHFYSPVLYTAEKSGPIGSGMLTCYLDGIDKTPAGPKPVTIDQFGNSEPVRINATGDPINEGYTDFVTRAILIYQITDVSAWQSGSRATIEAWIVANT